ncbi:MAG: DinB family protein [Isosphaeraceae bacterium]|nr:DinB family protein [Isosphaeraceae bacterium]
MELETRLFSLTVDLTKKLIDGIDPLQFALQNAPGMNPPAWIVGHLTVVADMGCALVGATSELGDDWRQRFAPGSTPTSNLADYPSPADLVARFDDACARLLAAVASADPARLASPQSTPFFRKALPTIGDLTAHILTTHPMFHNGQLSAWRRLNGYGSVQRI